MDLPFPDDYEGPVNATLVRLRMASAPKGAVLYVHGFIDYFFQRHMAERFAAEGYAFYALDLRKYGRSLQPHQHPNFCRSLREYYADISRALLIIGRPVLLAAHSTGGLICSLYAHEGDRRQQIKALWLNSPFFEFNVPKNRRLALVVGGTLGRFFPYLKDSNAVSPRYVKSLHKDYTGEWDFDLRLKPVNGFPAYFGWVNAIREGHARIRAGLKLQCPVLSMHSDESDIILNWRDIARLSPQLGIKVAVKEFPGGFHDLVLSRKDIREAVFDALFAWMPSIR